MKIINPVGRNISLLDTQAHFGNCHCMCSNGSLNAYYSSYEFAYCACQCSYGPANQLSNENRASIYFPV